MNNYFQAIEKNIKNAIYNKEYEEHIIKLTFKIIQLKQEINDIAEKNKELEKNIECANNYLIINNNNDNDIDNDADEIFTEEEL